MAQDNQQDRQSLRLRRFLAQGPASIEPSSRDDAVMLVGEDGALMVERKLLRSLARKGMISLRGETIVLAAGLGGRTETGEPGDDAFLRQHRETGRVRLDAGEGSCEVRVNLAESPLGQLARYRLRDGTPFLAQAEFDAGERLRADYTRGRIIPRLGANWEASVAPGRRSGGGGLADLTDAALASRQCVDNALGAVGPELGGVLVDVCCFLKGLELVERERGWPVRSAKVVLKTALGALARHYQPKAGRAGSNTFVHWGSDDYRPDLR